MKSKGNQLQTSQVLKSVDTTDNSQLTIRIAPVVESSVDA